MTDRPIESSNIGHFLKQWRPKDAIRLATRTNNKKLVDRLEVVAAITHDTTCLSILRGTSYANLTVIFPGSLFTSMPDRITEQDSPKKLFFAFESTNDRSLIVAPWTSMSISMWRESF